MVFGINVAGGLAGAPIGKLDVWIRTFALAEIIGVPDTDIRGKLRGEGFSIVAEGADACTIRLSVNEEAHRLIGLLRDWAKQGQ